MLYMFLDSEFWMVFITAVIFVLLVIFLVKKVKKVSSNRVSQSLSAQSSQVRERFSFQVAIIFGALAIFGHGFIGWFFPSFLGSYLFIYLLFFTPYFSINFLGFGFTKKKTALSIFGISTVALIIALIVFLLVAR